MLPVKYLVEFLGTFLFLYMILESSKYNQYQPFVIVIGLLAVILMFGAVSGGHFNPAITAAMWFKGDNSIEPIGYIAAQVLGAVAAFKVHALISGNSNFVY